VQAEQHRQADLAGQERDRHHDPDDHEAVAAPDAVPALGGAVMLVARTVHLPAVAVEEGVVHRYGDRAADGHDTLDDRLHLRDTSFSVR